MFVRTLVSFFVPCGLPLLAAAILVYTGVAAKSLPGLMIIYPWAVFGGGILLAWRFNESRLVFAILVLALADRSLHFFAGSSTASIHVGDIVYSAVGLLVPLNLAAFSMVKEKGVLTVRGILRQCLFLDTGLSVYCSGIRKARTIIPGLFRNRRARAGNLCY